MSWEPVIGIETHVELKTDSKMFCGCAVGFGEEPNTNVCPVCLGLPGALPVTNQRAIEWITAIGLALDCQISSTSVFHRKNYFYADLPKNYQISQYDIPVCHDGHLDVDVDGETIRVGIERAHMEEDTGKSRHVGGGGRIHQAEATLLDFNRSGVPLVEIVSRPDIHSAAQARAYAQELRAVVAELGVSDARMEEGSIRFDANVSVRPAGSSELGTKVEIKNMNSFRSLERAIDFEITRQIAALERGEKLVQETRHWDEESGVTHTMRVKEGSSDYRYFTEPDLPPLVLDEDWVERIAATLPELPSARRARYAAAGLDPQIASVLSSAEPELRQLYEDAVAAGADPKAAANWVTGDVTAGLRRLGRAVEEAFLSGEVIADLVKMVTDGKISSSAAKEVLAGVMEGEGTPAEVAEKRDLLQISDSSELEGLIASVLEQNPDAVERYRSGEAKVIGFLVGQVMKTSGGKADPKLVNELLRRNLES
ncbi:MAG TPA: Asp-tRNA(Asn)/Glu-tRNA(Gln) amidotransferase subunit GatB [Acidimicrobiia bacterium]|jgi:aspartyl-tRNA(Asn)/glutamyl-tRNA(Gln) amidotransferase subunit B